MAIDSRSKRASCLGIAMAATLTLPLVDGAVGQLDRQHAVFSYAGLAAMVTASAALGGLFWGFFGTGSEASVAANTLLRRTMYRRTGSRGSTST